MSANVKAVKLTNGEDFFADIEVTGKTTKIKNPVRFVMTAKGIQMIPYLMFWDAETVEIDNKYIMFTGDADPDIVRGYNEQFGTILIPPTQSILTLDN